MAGSSRERFGDEAIAHSVPDPRCGGRSQSPNTERDGARRTAGGPPGQAVDAA
jgi:hypothetical protein